MLTGSIYVMNVIIRGLMKNQYDKSPTEEHENPYAFQNDVHYKYLTSDWFK